MKNIRNWNDLAKYGIMPLTGEADRTGQRILCDLNPEGKHIVCDLLGLSEEIPLRSCYNRGVGSMMLPYNLFNDLATWCLLVADKCHEVFYVVRMKGNSTLIPNGGVTGSDSEETLDEWNEHINFNIGLGCEIRRIRIRTNHPGEGTRATHQFSGRTT